MRVIGDGFVSRRVVVKVETYTVSVGPYISTGDRYVWVVKSGPDGWWVCRPGWWVCPDGGCARMVGVPGWWGFRGSLVESVGLWDGQPNVSEGCAGP